MSIINVEDRKQFTRTRWIAIGQLIVAPVYYLYLANIITKDHFQAQESATLIMYLLIPIAVILPLNWILIRKVQIGQYKNMAQKTSVAKMYWSMMLIRLSFVAAGYIFGIIAFFLTNDMMNMAWFYVIGIVWSVIYWPRKSHFERVMNDGLEAI